MQCSGRLSRTSNHKEQRVKGLIVESAVLVLAEQRLTDSRSGRLLQKRQASLEGVVDFDLAPASNNGDTASTSRRTN